MPISRAVAASTALPMVYKPVEIKGRQLIDGGIRSTTNVDIAVERGAKFVIVVNPLVPVRERLPEGHPDDARQPRAPRGRHGLPADRLPDVQAAGPPAPARGGEALAGEVPGRRHHPDRARPQRRADVRDEHHELHQAGRDRPPRLRVGDAQARRGLRRAEGGLRQARHRDLGHARAQGRPQVRQGAREDGRLAADPRADDRRAAAGSPTRLSTQRCQQLPSAAQQPVAWRPVPHRDAHVVVGAQRAAGRHQHALLRAAARPARRRTCRRRPSQTKLAWLASTSTGSSRSASSSRARSRITDARRRSTSAPPIFSAWSTAAWVSAFTPSTGEIASSSLVDAVEPDRVAGAQARQAVDLREGADHRPAAGARRSAAARRRPARRPGSAPAPRRPARARARAAAAAIEAICSAGQVARRSGRSGCRAPAARVRSVTAAPSQLATRPSTATGRAAGARGHQRVERVGRPRREQLVARRPSSASAAAWSSSAAPLPSTIRSGSTSWRSASARRTSSAWRSG